MDTIAQKVPRYCAGILTVLQQSGYQTVLVGGCVRDCLLGKEPLDWDVTTAALPQQTSEILKSAGYRIIPTGIKHGTVTAVQDEGSCEVTTFRIDGSYSNNRHPDQVAFTPLLRQDLERRDFTINAMAWSPKEGLIDYHDGQDDLKNKIVRCVGDPKQRFQEDALRILRALRFCSILNFQMDEQTASAVKELAPLLHNIAAERISTEFIRLLCGPSAAQILREYRDVFAEFIPELRACFDFKQHNPYHCYDVWEHTLQVVEAIPPQPILRLAALFHDIGKPLCFSLDQDNIGHFYNHATIGAEITQTILRRLKFDRATIEQVAFLVREHSFYLHAHPKEIRKALSRWGESSLRQLLLLRHSDNSAKSAEVQNESDSALQLMQAMEKELEKSPCISLKQLEINGTDLIQKQISTPGEQMGCLLQQLLDAVIAETVKNNRDALLELARSLAAKPKQ